MDRIDSKTTTRIVGGHLVALLDNGQQVCGGSIIADNWVLTAAHCVDEPNITEILSDTQKLNRGGNRHKVTQIIIHAKWNKNNFANGNDLALIRINDIFNFDLERLKLANNSISQNAQMGTVSGWGLRKGKVPSSTSNELLEVSQTNH